MPAAGDRKPLVPPPLRLPTPLREYLHEEAAGTAGALVLFLAGRKENP
jgi:hypothetical protein